ncbi:MAG: flagellar hook-length control protein FliK [Brevinema sp.]
MIELLASVKIQQEASVYKKNNTDHSFQNHLDNSISQNKSLREELNQQKSVDRQKGIESIKKQIQALKKENVEDEGIDINTETLVSLEQILAFLQQDSLSKEPLEDTITSNEEFDFDVWVDDMLVVLQQTVDQLDQSSNPFILQKTAFILEIPTTEQMLTSVLEELNQSLSKNQLDYQTSDPLILEIPSSDVIALDESFVDFEKSLSNDSIIVGDDKEAQHPLDSYDFEDSEESPQKFEIKDFRVNKDQGSVLTLEEGFDDALIDDSPAMTLETIDSETPMVSQEQSFLLKNIAQHAYTSLSSAVSRVPVEALMQNITGKISMILQEGGNELRMKLTPPELGQMRLSFVSEDGMMRGKIIVETPEAKMFFEQNINNLRESLAHVGISLGGVDVELGGHRDFDAEKLLEDSMQAVRKTSLEKNQEQNTIKHLTDALVDFTA